MEHSDHWIMTERIIFWIILSIFSLDSGFYSYIEEEGNSATRDLNVSSLRRKLFSPDENQSPTMSRERQPPQPRATR